MQIVSLYSEFLQITLFRLNRSAGTASATVHLLHRLTLLSPLRKLSNVSNTIDPYKNARISYIV